MAFIEAFRGVRLPAYANNSAVMWLKRSARAAMGAFIGFLTIMLTGLSLATAAHAALSASCSKINSDFSVPFYTEIPANYIANEYPALSPGEKISWTFSTTGTAFGGTTAALTI